jgi:hypothetical protein
MSIGFLPRIERFEPLRALRFLEAISFLPSDADGA